LRCLTTIIRKEVVVEHNGLTREEPLHCDFQGEGCVVLEAKAVREQLPTHKAQLPSHTKSLDAPLRFLTTHHERKWWKASTG